MSLTNMQMSKEEAKEYAACAPSPDNAPKYPYGLSLCLNDDSLAKLGITQLPAVGSQLMVMANVTVTGVRASQEQSGDTEQSVDMQITDMALSAPTPDLAASLWPAAKADK